MVRKTILCLIALLGCMSAQAQLLWKITGPNVKTTSYLLGSHHLAPASMIDSIQGLRQAIESADAVYGEVEKSELDPMKQQQKLMEYAMAPADSTLNKVLTPEQFARLDSIMAIYMGMPGLASQLSQFKPNLVSTQLAVLMSLKAFPTFDSTNVFDVAVMGLGEEKGKPINGFETIEEQLQVLFGSPIADQAEDLMETVDKDQEMIQYALELGQAFERQDLEKVNQLMTNSECGMSEKSRKALITDRNHNWANKLQMLLPMRNLFIVVGSGHLLGDEGLIQLLRNLGYTVEPVKP
ncbi:MAG: TraB/GumN family protein [Bacteroidales bacterium]|nr:TraB/GumN family protein [Bacteroidales bacterium]